MLVFVQIYEVNLTEITLNDCNYNIVPCILSIVNTSCSVEISPASLRNHALSPSFLFYPVITVSYNCYKLLICICSSISTPQALKGVNEKSARKIKNYNNTLIVYISDYFFLQSRLLKLQQSHPSQKTKWCLQLLWLWVNEHLVIFPH